MTNTAFRRIHLTPAAPCQVFPYDDPFLPVLTEDESEEQVYYDPEYDPNEGTMSGCYFSDNEESESEEDLWYAAGCPTEEDISEFFARQRCD